MLVGPRRSLASIVRSANREYAAYEYAKLTTPRTHPVCRPRWMRGYGVSIDSARAAPRIA
jgi:hypothetical protein